MIHAKSDELMARANKVLAGGPATLSKLPSRYPGNAPAFLERGKGPYVFDVDGNKYVDTVAALGPIILGHDNRAVTAAVEHQAWKLASSTLSTSLEVEVAELLCEIIPGAELVRFATNGYDVTNSAIKLARRATGKRHIIFCGYHGCSDSYLSTTANTGGILDCVKEFNHQTPWGNFAHLNAIIEQCRGDLAGLMLEVPPEPYGTPKEETSRKIKRYSDYVHDFGGVFILDEVVTGFRYGPMGAQGYYGITADLATFSKGIANGYPCAAITGKSALMELFTGGEVFLSTTFGANPIGLAAAHATINELANGAHESLVRHGTYLCESVNDILKSFDLSASVRGNFARFVIDWNGCQNATSQELRTLWLQELCRHGVLAGVPWFAMTSYNVSVVDKVLFAVDEACEAIASVVNDERSIGEVLECPVIPDGFQRYEPRRNW